MMTVWLSGIHRLQAQDIPASPSVGCDTTAQTPPAFGEIDGELEFGDRQRTYLLYIPETYDPASPTPLVLSLHGFASWSQQQMTLSGWNDVADAEGFIVVYPAGTGIPLRWTVQPPSDNARNANPVDDVGFIAALLDMLSEGYCIDTARIYVNGLSNGGGMTYVLACTLADRIAAVGMVAGAYIEPADGCNPARPIPVISFHGTDDRIVPYDGGRSGGFMFPDIANWVAAWAGRNACDEVPESFSVSDAVRGIRYLNCDAEVVFYTIEGGGHSWPGGDPLPEQIVGVTTDEINASAVMWEFFRANPLEAAPTQ
jgi:polyhydroxybutyrate depolymerase